ncbi:GntR family transcriptional regulator [Treponema sp. J25]|uniref:GntR family transcriptional regulator n=1 Tax=Treponema sp. J25 TaxID=2094121 RepID=UPI00104B3870|nr:GntR family transcriptional regulator [Treponema sp. J25]TCW60720.1 GntR family transcriptional regulator [Treponema sp. J25]
MSSSNIRHKIDFILDPASGVPFYRQIIQQVEQAILAGRLVPGDRLPTIRSLAIELQINPNTIAKAYNELELRGLVVTQVGSGTYISDKKIDIEEAERQKKIEECLGRFFREMEALGVKNKEELIQLIQEFKEE